MVLLRKTANHNSPTHSRSQLSDAQPITLYSHSSLLPMILCDVISRRRSPSRSGNHTGTIYDSSFRDGEVLICLNKLSAEQSVNAVQFGTFFTIFHMLLLLLSTMIKLLNFACYLGAAISSGGSAVDWESQGDQFDLRSEPS